MGVDVYQGHHLGPWEAVLFVTHSAGEVEHCLTPEQMEQLKAAAEQGEGAAREVVDRIVAEQMVVGIVPPWE
jgi:hypothetical protein